MTELRTVERPCNIKVNDSGTKIQFYAYDDNGRISFTQNDTLLFKIKNSMGYVTEVQGQSSSGGYIAELNSSDLQVLTPDTYFIELWVTQNGNTTIYPDNAFCPVAVTQNVMSIAGNVLPTTSLNDFENSLKAYVEQHASTATTNIKNDFQSYVDSITDSTIKTAEKASQDAQSAISTANGAVDTANTAKSTAESAVSTANTAKSTADTATTKANNAQSTADSANNKSQANANLIISLSEIISQIQNATPNHYKGTSPYPKTYNGSGKMIINTTDSPYEYVELSDINVSSGNTYTFSIYIDNPTYNFKYKIECYSEKDEWLGNYYGNLIEANSSGYSTVTFKIPDNTTKFLHFVMPDNLNAPENTTVTISQENLVLGNIRTFWTPNPDDYVKKQ